MDPAPPEILNTVSCKCTKCSCRKVGMECSTICLNCNGQSCSNSAPFEDEDVTFIAVEAEIGEDSPFEDDPGQETWEDIEACLDRTVCHDFYLDVLYAFWQSIRFGPKCLLGFNSQILIVTLSSTLGCSRIIHCITVLASQY
ncbi:hypothetical protein JTB14_014015 [Gonioctena quinquepunctata]|nr:hypothetical protein JTB14_014015 [Gonioctena quinquepunctata]